MSPLKDYAPFQDFIMNAKNPLLGFAVGVILCAVIQSSSAAGRRTAGSCHAGADALVLCGIYYLWDQCRLVCAASFVRASRKE